MDKRVENLKKFVSDYGYDYLNDGTKAKILRKIENGDSEIINEILQAIDSKWVNRVKEIGRFNIFSDGVAMDENLRRIRKPYVKANYMDSLATHETQIPVLRRIRPKDEIYYDVLDFDDDDRDTL